MSETETGITETPSSIYEAIHPILNHFGDRVDSVEIEWMLGDATVRSTVRLASGSPVSGKGGAA